MAVNKDAIALAAKVNKAMPGSIQIASDMHIPKRFSSGSVSIDVAMGGGFAANQWYEIFGNESHGKTAVVLKLIAACQSADPSFTTLWIAGEHYDQEQAEALGVDNSRVILRPGQDMEEAFQTIIDFLAARSVDLVVVDSYPALIANDEEDKGMDEFSVAVGARVMGKFFRKMGSAGKRDPLNDHDAPWFGIMVNQNRDDIGSWSPRGTPTTTPGGKAKNYAYYARLEVKRVDWILEKIEGKGSTKVGQVIRIQAVKNKGGPPQRIASVDFYFTDAPTLGFSRGDYDVAKDLVTMALLFDVVARKGKYYYFEDQKWSPKEQLYNRVREDVGLQEELRAAVLVASMRPDDKRTWEEEDVADASDVESEVVPVRGRRVIR